MSALPKIVLRRLHAANPETREVHPDPNLISAFVEDSLPRAARTEILRHLANCADCRELTFLWIADQATTAQAVTSSRSTWLTWPVLRWGTAVAAVVVVAAAVGLHRQMGQGSMRPGAIQASVAPVTKPLTGLDQKKTAVGPTAISGMAENPAAEASHELGELREGRATSAVAAQNSEPYEGRDGRERHDADKAVADQVPGKAKDAAAALAARKMPSGPNGPAIFMPMVAPRWALTADGRLQRSVDLGNSWQMVDVAERTTFHAVAANGKDIWVGGSNGALYHSTDAGRDWTQVQPSTAGETLTGDIVGLEFSDLLHGKVTTVSNAVWITDDGGRTWRKP